MSAFWFSRYPLEHFLVVSAVIFTCGVYTIITRKNAVSILMGVELVLNAANINFIAFARWANVGVQSALQGPVFTIFVIVLAAAEAAVALAIIIGIYQNFGRVDVDQADAMKE